MSTKPVLNGFSRAGFRTCIEWYVHAGNFWAFEEQIPKLLIANYSSGFSLPLISRNPYYKFGAGYPALPHTVEYCQFLTRIYGQYPYYDDVFAPLNDLSFLIAEGIGQSKLNVPSEMHLIVNEKGEIGTYRHSAALAAPWASISGVLDLSPDMLRESFIHAVAGEKRHKFVPYCDNCEWKYICCGLDEASAKSLTKPEMDTLCGHRKLFLRHFATLRESNCLIGKLKEQMTASQGC